MPRGLIVQSDLPFQGADEDVTFTAGDETNDMYFVNEGLQFVLIDNGDAVPVVITFVSVADKFGRTQDLVVTVPATSIGMAGPFLPGIWNQSGTPNVNVDMVSDTSLTLAAVRFTPNT